MNLYSITYGPHNYSRWEGLRVNLFPFSFSWLRAGSERKLSIGFLRWKHGVNF